MIKKNVHVLSNMDSTAEALEAITFAECRPFLPSFRTAKCVKVYDGEILHFGFYMENYGATRFTCRLVGIDTPELRAKSKSEKMLAKISREEVKAVALNKVVSVTINGLDKYGRLLVRVRTPTVDDVSQHLINSGLAIAYDGGRKRKVDWDSMLKEWMRKCNMTRCNVPVDEVSDEDED